MTEALIEIAREIDETIGERYNATPEDFIRILLEI
jgi:hypothetical protein